MVALPLSPMNDCAERRHWRSRTACHVGAEFSWPREPDAKPRWLLNTPRGMSKRTKIPMLPRDPAFTTSFGQDPFRTLLASALTTPFNCDMMPTESKTC